MLYRQKSAKAHKNQIDLADLSLELVAKVNNAILRSYETYKISPELYSYDLKLIQKLLPWLADYLSKGSLENWHNKPFKQKKLIVRQLFFGIAEIAGLNLAQVNFKDPGTGRFKNRIKTLIAIATNDTDENNLPISSVTLLKDFILKGSIEAIETKRIVTIPAVAFHEMCHVYQGFLRSLLKHTMALEQNFPIEDVKTLIQEKRDRFDKNGRQIEAGYHESLIERHADAFEGALVAALKIIIPQSFGLKPTDKLTPAF